MTASLENCKRLFKLSGWEDTDKWLIVNEFGESSPINSKAIHNKSYPAYSAGYLLRKITEAILNADLYDFELYWYRSWKAMMRDADDKEIAKAAGTPEDALCLLSIRLIEEGVLKP